MYFHVKYKERQIKNSYIRILQCVLDSEWNEVCILLLYWRNNKSIQKSDDQSQKGIFFLIFFSTGESAWLKYDEKMFFHLCFITKSDLKNCEKNTKLHFSPKTVTHYQSSFSKLKTRRMKNELSPYEVIHINKFV